MFSDCCLIPILCFLTTCKRLSTLCSIEKSSFRFLEDLLVKNILLPTRNSFLSLKESSEVHSGGLSPSPSEDLLAPLENLNNTEAWQITLKRSPNHSFLPISLFFNIAIRCVSRSTPKKRSIEDSWLQNLFGQFTQYAFKSYSASGHVPLLQHYLLTLNQMLEDVAYHNIRFTTFEIEKLLSRVWGFLDGNVDTPSFWDLVGLCIEIDASVIINESSADSDNRENRPGASNKHLTSLLSFTSVTNGSDGLGTCPNYEKKLNRLILPLANAFTKGRDLLGFISLWQEQLATSQKYQRPANSEAPSGNYFRSIWEDEKLLHLVARLIEISLTVGQVETLLHKARLSIVSAQTSTSNKSDSAADLVILDCITDAKFSESYLDQLVSVARTTYISVLSIVSVGTYRSIEQAWRFWRILITFNEHWSIPRDSSEFVERQAMDHALNIVSSSWLNNKTFSKHDYMELVYIFTSILCVGSKSESNERVLYGCSAIETIYSQSNTLLPELPTQWSGQNNTIDSAEVAFLACTSQVISYPNVLRYGHQAGNAWLLTWIQQIEIGLEAYVLSAHLFGCCHS